MAPVLGIIADDFTGATLVAALLETQGVAAPLLFRPEGAGQDETAPILIAAARSRTIPKSEAMEQVSLWAGALRRAGCTRFAYKACASFDSTAEGNIGPAADLLAELMDRRPVLMSAGFPRYGVTVHQGYLFYRGRLVSESLKRLDPLTPMEDPDLVRFLGRQTPHSVGLVPHARLIQGAAPALQALDELTAAGMGHVLCDASDDADIEATTALALARGLPVAASDPLIVDLALRLAATQQGSGVARPQMPAGPVAVLAGSTGPVVMEQLAILKAEVPLRTLDLLDPSPEAAQVAAAVDWAAGHGGAVAISTACDAADLARTQGALGAVGAARKAERLIGGVAAGLAARGQRRFAVAGGETSGAVVGALGVRRARALPEGPLGQGFCVTEDDIPLGLYLKSGKLGAADVLLRAARGEGFGR